MSIHEHAGREELHLPFAPENPLKYQVQQWFREGVEPVMLVHIPHNSFACDPDAVCNGMVIVSFEKHALQFKSGLCQECEKRVEVDLASLQIGLGIW